MLIILTSYQEYMVKCARNNSGNWDFKFYNIKYEQAKEIEKNKNIKEIGKIYKIGITKSISENPFGKTDIELRAYDRKALEHINLNIVEGRSPESSNEIIVQQTYGDGFKIDEKSVKRAGLDYWDKLEIEEHESLEKFLEKYQPEENHMYYATTKGQHCYSDVDYSNMQEVFILFGKETKGLPEDLLQKYIQNTIRIPMREHLRSLNLSNSVAIVTYELLRQVGFNNLEQESKYFK